MVSINYASREVSCKIVYYGPGLSGKTTNLQYVHAKVPSDTKGKLISLATDADRTLYFDFLPINIGKINGFDAKFQLYTVPGQVYYNATRKLVLRGADGVVFVADSQPDKLDENIESLNNLKENLAEYDFQIEEMPFVIQYNKQDLPGVLSAEELHAALNTCNWPEFCASATEGFGVFDTLKCILKLVLDKAKAVGEAGRAGRSGVAPAGQAQASAAPVPQPQAVPQSPPQPIPQQQAPPVSQPAPLPQSAPVQPLPVPTAQPIPQPVAPAAFMSQHTPQPTEQVTQQTVAPPAPVSVDQPVDLQRQPVDQNTEMTPSPEMAYRPFPGNTMEDEEQMQVLHQQQRNRLEITKAETNNPSAGNEDNIQSSQPHMAPSLRAESTEKSKKRSFFKRLFGLK
jgi:signal recognition particle receptor subunit beta